MTKWHLRAWRGRMIVALAAIGLLGSAPALAAPRSAEAIIMGGERIVIGKDEIIADDLYAFGTTVTIDGTVQGDVIASGSEITINGTVEGDLMAAGQNVFVNGTIGDDVRVAGSLVRFGSTGSIGDDTLAAAMNVEQQSGNRIGGDAFFAGSQGLIAGTIDGNLEGDFDGLLFSGTLGGNMDVAVGDARGGEISPFVPGSGIATVAIEPGLTIDPKVRIGGALRYTAPQSARIPSAAAIAGEVSHTPVAPVEQATLASTLLGIARRWATLMAIGLLLLWLAPRWTTGLAATVRSRPLPTLGWGTIALLAVVGLLIAIPVLAILLMVLAGRLTLGGVAAVIFVWATAGVSGLLSGFTVAVSYLAQIVVGLVAGRWLLARVRPQWIEQRIAPLALGLTLYVLLRAVPFAGPLVALAVTLLGLGAIWQWGRGRLSSATASEPARQLRPAPGM